MTSAPDYERRFDRHLGLASELAGEAREHVIRKFIGQRVLLTGDPSRLATPTGRVMFVVSANLIARFCPKIDVFIDAAVPGLADETLSLLRRIDCGSHAEFRAVTSADDSTYAAILAIGAAVTGLPIETVIDAVGWLAAISNVGKVPPFTVGEDRNPFGALLAAALGTAEVFKHLLRPLPDKASTFGTVTVSAYDYAVDAMDPGPALPASIVLPVMLLGGVGAVGNALLLSLSRVPGVRGDLYAVDGEHVDDPSNLNRYSLAEEADADLEHPTPKTELAVRLFKGGDLKVHPLQKPLKNVLNEIFAGEIPRPGIVLSAVDNNEARDLLQKLWPTLLLEGATDQTLAQVSRHEYGSGLGCLLCIHSTARDDGFSYLAHVAALSGLREDVIAASHRDADRVVTDADVQNAPEPKRAGLALHVGKPICSALTELERLSAKPPEQLPHQPTVSFVSMISGLLMAGELVKYACGFGSTLKTFFQLDAMFPLQNAFLQAVDPVPTCYCITRRESIQRYRQALTQA